VETFESDSVRAQLERILKSPPLESSPSLCRFLRYVVEETLAGRGGLLKEYSLGAEVFERGDQFDPRLDPIVRVQARNLRARLAQYYAGLGAGDPLVIELPKRTYVPVFRKRVVLPEDQAQRVEMSEGREDVASPAVPMAGAAEVPEVVRTAISPADVIRKSAIVSGKRRTGALLIATLLVVLSGIAAFWPLRPGRASAHQPDPQAQDLYIRGRQVMDRQTEHALKEAVDCFQQAIARDGQFAQAYAGLADASNLLAQYGYIPPVEGMQQARQAAERAITIDPSLAEGHVSLAAVIEAYDWNWNGAETEYRRALALNSWLAPAHLWYGMFLRDQGRLNEALPELRRAAQLEPFSVLTSINLAHGLMAAGNYQGAVDEARHAAEMAPDLVTAQVMLSGAYRCQALNADSEAALARAAQFAGDNPHSVAVVARTYARIGNRDESIKLLHQLEAMAKERYVSPFDMGTVLLALGDEDGALERLQEAYRQRSSGMIFLRDAKFASMHRAPEFHLLIEKMHFAG
jgi:tetratricopeptide (TPR) repeat protein